MSIPSRILVLFIVARILVPPCMCLCKLEAPASRAVAWVFGKDVPNLPQEPDDHDHDPGCPASYLSLGLGLKPLPFLEPEPSDLTLPAYTPSLPAATIDVPVTTRARGFPTDPPLYVSHCALTV